MTRHVRMLVLPALVLTMACGNTPALNSASPTLTPASSPTLAKPSAIQAPLVAPTYVRWGVDKSGFPDRPYDLVFFYDGVATSFRILDASGQVVLRVPIAGSGVFGPETCVVRARRPSEGSTYVVVDSPTLERFVANASSYRTEADSVGGRTVTVPLTDSGCRGS